MRANIAKVTSAFKRGAPAIGDSKRTCWTDGITIYSYRMPIARRIDGIVYIVRTGPSQTTRSQIRAVEIAIPANFAIDSLVDDATTPIPTYLSDPTNTED